MVKATADVTLVIPGRNAAHTVGACLESVLPLVERGELAEIVFVDDGSQDNTRDIVDRYPVRCIRGSGDGPGAARNWGFRSVQTPLVWFIDSDCVAEPEALSILRESLDQPDVAAVSGSYANQLPEQLLPSLIHEEIVERHRRMPVEVNFQASFNLLYRKSVLDLLDGFDERFRKAQDAELAYRTRKAGYRLKFDIRSRVAHFHENQWWRYMDTQRQQGYWRAWLYLSHPEMASGDDYSGPLDHVQPALALATLALLPLSPLAPAAALQRALFGVLAAAQLPMTGRLLLRTGDWRMALFAGLGLARSFSRGVGLAQGATSGLLERFTRS